MNKIFWGVAALGVFIIVAMNNTNSTTTGATAQCEVGRPSSGRFYPKADETEFRTGPGANFPMVANAAAPRADGKTEYRTLDRDVVLNGLCTTGEWLQAKIVAADGSPVDWETGWVPTRLVTTTLTPDQAAGLWWDVNKYPDMGAEPSSVPMWEKNLMHDGALKVLKDNKNCDAIYAGYTDGRKRHASYTVECSGHGGFKVQFTASDVRSGKSFTPPEPFSSELSNEMCREAILGAANHPSTVNFHIFGTNQAVDMKTGERKILREFDAKNGFGLELNYAALCVVSPTGRLKLAINETR